VGLKSARFLVPAGNVPLGHSEPQTDKQHCFQL